MHTALIEPTFEAWRAKARELLQRAVAPEDVCWEDATQTPAALLPAELIGGQASSSATTALAIKVPPAFLALASQVCAHADPRRFGVLYRLLHRLTRGGQRHLLSMPADSDTRQCQMWAKAVSREIHKMHAYLRFRLVGVDEASGREQFIAWFEPEFRVLRLAAPFFEKRFAGMDWAILTPDECAAWNGQRLEFFPGVPRAAAPAADAQDDLWRAYYCSIFNPARLKVRAMQSSMPRKYWKNMPETQAIPQLIAASQNRVAEMLQAPARPVKPPASKSLPRAPSG